MGDLSQLFSLSLCLYAVDLALLLRLKQISESARTSDPDLSALMNWMRKMGPEQLFMMTFFYVVLLVFARFFGVVYAILLPLQLFSIAVNVFLNGRLRS
jgi:hypothetical protein